MKIDLEEVEDKLDMIFNITFKLFGIVSCVIGIIIFIYILIK